MSNDSYLRNVRKLVFTTVLFVPLASIFSGEVHAQSPVPPPAAESGAAPQESSSVRVEKEEKAGGRNLLANGDFKAGTAGWELYSWGKKSNMEIDRGERHEGKPALRVNNLEFGHSFIRQVLTGKANTRYRLSGFIKTKDIQVVPGKKSGAVLMVGRLGVYTPLMEGTKPWTKVTVDFVTKEDAVIRVGPSLGTDPVFVKGTAWFSDLKLVELGEGR